MEEKPSTQRVRLFLTFTGQLKMSECQDDFEFQNFSLLNYSKFAAECD